jgi:cation:H+ antiporter
LIRPIKIHAQLIRLDAPIVITCSLLVTVLLLDDRLGRLEGLFLILGLSSYVAFTVHKTRKERGEVQDEFGQATPAPRRGPWFHVVLMVGGLGLLFCGGGLFVHGAVATAVILGVSQAVVALTFVALGTSLPELATCAVAATRNQGDVAIGNVVGSNVFNLLGILGTASVVRPLALRDLDLVDLGMMVGVALLLVPLMRTGRRISRWEGALLVALYASYIGWLVP